jgi:hypothetical protein
MSTDRLWAITVVIGFTTLLILSCFVLTPLSSKESVLIKTEGGLREAINEFDQLKGDEQSSDKSNTNP